MSCLRNKTKVYKHVTLTKQHKNKMFTDKLCLQNKTKSLQTSCLQNKVYKHVMFTKHNKKFTNTLCLQNKTVSLQTRCFQNKYVKFTKQKQNVYKHVVYRQVMFTKQNKTESLQTRYVYKTKQRFTDKLCLQNKTES